MYNLGIDLGGTNIAAGIVDDHYKILFKGSVPTGADRAPEDIIASMAQLIQDLLNKAGLTADDISHTGIATPGTANPATGTVEYANNLPFINFPIAKILQSFVPLKNIYIENDANAAAYGEAIAGAAKGSKNSVMITLGTGVGGGIIVNNSIFSGFNHAAGELGHIVIEYDGYPCSCTRKGCWESYSSATALIRMTREKIEECEKNGRKTIMSKLVKENNGRITGRTSFDALRQGDKAAAEVVEKYTGYLACGLTNIINIFQPEVLCIGGGISNEREHLIEPLIPIINKEQYTRLQPIKTQIKIAKLGNDAGIIGASSLYQQYERA
ncbi:MAG: ROK family protein [Clostridiales bacterium]|nr:ROK family protein [Clostridiales bacterium]